MNLPVASCLVCGEEKELAVWVDPAVTGGSFHGVCFQCRQAAQHGVQRTGFACDVDGCKKPGVVHLCEDHGLQ